ncbi:SAM-dependent methyltransferase [Leucobacter exalbidus]|uniref:SAM-dependent methyltransferase n=1 Tax=Leucobacter exalbidus TaxID=662960 RepID=A0A940PRK0_9MICO|nr:class I SAM-dependent methyltransferase [Leucobacter exalbidus]MBP1326239.1 SAM-dependent methyltransferase [Leucobacter exalbidus]
MQAHNHGEHAATETTATPAEFWEQRYAESGQIWSGRVNHTLAQVASAWQPGRSLDLGCGEGGDALWLAEQGWAATGIDLSPTAVARAHAEAAARGLENARFVAADLQDWVDFGPRIDATPDGFDLITASFMQSPVELPRERILQAATARLTQGGRLMILSHAAAPPWAKNHPGEFLSPVGELALLGIDDAGSGPTGDWTIEIAEVRERQATGPDGHQHRLDDTVVVVRRNR